jgi:serine/threonine protein kinase/WD40 repeat protein
VPVCPGREQLRSYLINDLSVAADQQVLEHIDHCSACQHELEELTAGPFLVAKGIEPTEEPPATWLDRLIAAGSAGRSMIETTLSPGLVEVRQGASSRMGPYELVRELGRGGMGVVYVARQQNLNRLVALKMLLAGGHASADALARLRSEAKVLALMQHPNIVQIHDIGEQAGQPFLVMEYLAGGDLEEYLQRQPLPPCLAAELLVPLAEAIDAAHRAGIVHRDLKPANILLAVEGTVSPDGAVCGDVVASGHARPPIAELIPKITDFGLAKRLEEEARLTRSGLMIGTPSYMAPEQADATRAVGPAVDLWALGAVLCTCLTGRPPFLSDSPAKTLMQVLRDEPVPPSRLQPGVPRDLETICLKCLEKDPARRYASARDLAEDLRRFLRGEPIRARPAKPWQVAGKWARRQPAAAALLAVFLLLALVGLPSVTALWFQADQQRREKEQERDRANMARDDLERAVYAGRIVLAQRAYRDNDLGMARSLLDRVGPEPGRPDLRGWEYRYLRHLCQADLYRGMGHTREGLTFIHSLAVSPDGRRAVTSVGLAIGQTDEQGRDRRHAPGEVVVWNLETGRPQWRTDHVGAVDAVAISSDGLLLALGGGEGGIRVLDLETGKPRQGPPPVAGSVYSLAFSPRDRALAIASDRVLVIWDFEANRERSIATYPTPRYRPRVAFRPDGRLLLAVAPEVNGVQAWDVDTAAEVPVPLGEEPANTLAFSPDGSLLALARGQEIEVWDTVDWRLRQRLAAHARSVEALAFAPNGWLASGSDDRSIRVWDATQGRELLALRGHTGGVTCLGFTADSQRLVSGDKEQVVKVWDVTHPPEGRAFQVTPLGSLGEWVANLAFAADGQDLRVVVLGKTGPRFRVHGWDADDGRLISERPLSALGPTSTAVSQEAILSADGRWLAAATSDEPGTLSICDADSAEEVCSLRTGAALAMPLALTADGRMLAYMAWELPTGEAAQSMELGVAEKTGTITTRIELPPGRTVDGACFSPDGHVLAGAEGSGTPTAGPMATRPPWDLVLWEAATGRERRRFRGVELGPRPCLAFSPGGDRLATVDLMGAIRIWDVETGRLAIAALSTATRLTGLAYSPDGNRLAVAGLDDRVRLYDAVAGHELLQLHLLGKPATGIYGFAARVAFSHDGHRLAANGWDGKVTIWTASPEQHIPAQRR